jgi:GrpB-like predicted nucleotidyltransferase (UPF0157 family)/aminoglycoside phosphotransferase (APT) family kinase protein/GNAT superfamily N-acetyltransferase
MMTFKTNWEKTSNEHSLSEDMVEKMVQLAYPDKMLMSHEFLAGGCANLNIKIQFESAPHLLILRVYFRDKDAAYREQKLGALLKATAPVPLTYYVGEIDGYHFAITEFMTGTTLRDLLLGDLPHDLGAMMHEAGDVLSRITAHEFLSAGFFDKNLNVTPHSTADDIQTFAKACLQKQSVISNLTTETISKINGYLDKYALLLTENCNEKHLVHADFDPANILVNEVDGIWKISGILDWEFAFSGSVLWDVANMLRYAHKMPPEFQTAFLKGLTSNGVSLPENWQITVHMLNLLSLLDLLKRSDHHKHPHRCADIRELIDYILLVLDRRNDTRSVEVISYNVAWPQMCDIEAEKIKKALGDNCITIHHIGSTSIPGLAAKPIIDMVPIVHDISAVDRTTKAMEALGYEAKGEFGMLFRRFFQKKGFNIHVFEQSSAEIDGHLKFRDWMRTHPDDMEDYANLKKHLATIYPNDILQYVFGKDSFVRNILIKTGFTGLRVVKALTPREWTAARHFRQTNFFDKVNMADPYTWTFNHPQHEHFVLYQGAEIIGYAHIQLWPEARAAMRIIVIDEAKRNKQFGGQFLALCERWLKSQGYKSLHIESSPAALGFYQKNGYVEMPFNDPDGYVGYPEDTAVGKQL